MARQCLVAVILHQPGVESSASAEGGLIVIKDLGVICQWADQGREV